MPAEDTNEPVRVKDKDTGAIYTIRRVSLPHGNYQELKQDAVNPLTGEFMPVEYPQADSAAAATKEK
jgi:hypothetical protein